MTCRTIVLFGGYFRGSMPASRGHIFYVRIGRSFVFLVVEVHEDLFLFLACLAYFIDEPFRVLECDFVVGTVVEERVKALVPFFPEGGLCDFTYHCLPPMAFVVCIIHVLCLFVKHMCNFFARAVPHFARARNFLYCLYLSAVGYSLLRNGREADIGYGYDLY